MYILKNYLLGWEQDKLESAGYGGVLHPQPDLYLP